MQNRAIEAAQVIEELIELAKEMRAANARGESLGLTEDELAFYDALEANDSAVKLLGDETCAPSRESWWSPSATTSRSTGPCARTSARSFASTCAGSCASTGTPPDKQEKATQTVIEQAEVLCAGLA